MGEFGTLQLVYAFDEPRVQSVAAMLVDSSTSARAAQTFSRKTADLGPGDVKSLVDAGLGETSVIRVGLTMNGHAMRFSCYSSSSWR